MAEAFVDIWHTQNPDAADAILTPNVQMVRHLSKTKNCLIRTHKQDKQITAFVSFRELNACLRQKHRAAASSTAAVVGAITSLNAHSAESCPVQCHARQPPLSVVSQSESVK